MQTLNFNYQSSLDFIRQEEILSLKDKAKKANVALHEKSGEGNAFLGWVDLPNTITDDFISDINKTASELKEKIDVLVVVGIGGSYLGAKSVLEALSNSFHMMKPTAGSPVVLFAGHNIGEDYSQELLDVLKEKSYAVVVISKSGTTTEPALAFRLLKQDIEARYGKEEAKNRIIAITDQSKGALRQLATEEGYKTYVIPDDVGGRYSVLTPVGLLPIAIAGFDIAQLVKGAKEMAAQSSPSVELENNIAEQYAIVRNLLYNKGMKIEILVNYHPKMHYVSEWWKQLYGESEGKDGKGIFPAAVDNSTDLHSMGQYVQQGERTLFETVISIQKTNHNVLVPEDEANLDKLNYLVGKKIDEVNKMAELGTRIAHLDGGVPNLLIEMPELNEYYLGQLFYFFEKACGISGYILGINPFNQPGVEDYKRNMFALLGKPGYEDETKKINERLK